MLRIQRVLSLKVRKNGQQKTSNLFCNIAATRVQYRCFAFYHPCSNLLTSWFVAREVWCGWKNAQHRYSTRFTAKSQNKLPVSCCSFCPTFTIELSLNISSLSLLDNKLHFSGRGRVGKWWEQLPPTNVARVYISVSTPYVGWVCCRFSPLFPEIFLLVLRVFLPLLKNQHFRVPIGEFERIDTLKRNLKNY